MRLVLFAAALAVASSFAAQAQSNELAFIGDSLSAGTSTGTYTGAKACSSAWIFGICDVVTQSNSATRTQVGQIVDSFNPALGSVVAAAPQTYAHIAVGSDWEGTISAGDANTSIGTYAFTRDDINGGDLLPFQCQLRPMQAGLHRLQRPGRDQPELLLQSSAAERQGV